jgi:hypothetical protein
MLAERPHGTVTRVCATDADRQSTYGLLNNDAIEPSLLILANGCAAARQAAAYEFVFVPVDGSSIVVTDRPAKKKKLGPIGSPPSLVRGLKVMSSIAVTPDGVPLGVLDQQYWARPPERTGKKGQARPIEDKESNHWLLSVAAVTSALEQHAPDTRAWFQLDREGDFSEMLHAADDDYLVTIRSSVDRRLATGKTLRAAVRSTPVLGRYSIHIPAGPNRTERTARLAVRTKTVSLRLRKPKLRTISIQVVHAVECSQASQGSERIEWFLLTTASVNSFKAAMDVIDGYTMRWTIEEFHKTWKTGHCNVESMQLRAGNALQKLATLLAAVAMRAARLCHLAREKPDLPASTEFTKNEIEATIVLRQPKGYRRGDAIDLKTIVRWIADLGGYVGSKSSGPPGKIVFGRGLALVATAVRAIKGLRAQET